MGSQLTVLATLIGYDSGYLNGVLASDEFIHRYGVSDDNGATWYLKAHTRSLFTSMFVPGTIIGCLLASAIPDRGMCGCAIATGNRPANMLESGPQRNLSARRNRMWSRSCGSSCWSSRGSLRHRPSCARHRPRTDIDRGKQMVLPGIHYHYVNCLQTPVYLVEASSGTTRGRMIAIYLQLLTCGNVLACAISLATSKLEGSKSWRKLSALPSLSRF